DRRGTGARYRAHRIARRALFPSSSRTPGCSGVVSSGGRGGGTESRTASTPVPAAVTFPGRTAARLASTRRPHVNRQFLHQLAAGPAHLGGRRSLPPEPAVLIEMGEEQWRERPRFRASNAAQRVISGSFTPLFPVSVSRVLWTMFAARCVSRCGARDTS